MKAANHRGQHVAVLGMVVVAGAIEVGRHHAAEVAAVLAVVAFAQLDAGDLGDGVGLVGRLQLAGQKRILRHGLRREPRIDAARAKEEQLACAGAPSLVDQIGFDHQVRIDELGRIAVVGVDTADLCRRHIDLLRLFLGEEGSDLGLVRQVEFGMSSGDEVGVAFFDQAPHDRAAYHAAVSRHENPLLKHVH
jgi:hypothetical protein